MRRTIRDPAAKERSFTDLYIDPAPLRPNSEDALQYPSRVGQRLYYRDGRITDLSGNPLKKGALK